MSNRLTEILAPTILGGVFMWATGVGSSLLTLPKAEATIGPELWLAEGKYTVLRITNFSRTPLPVLRVSLKNGTPTSSIVSSSGLGISQVPESTAAGALERVQIEGIEGRSDISILVPGSADDLAILNAHELGLSLRDSGSVAPPLHRAARRAAIDAATYMGFLGIALFFWFRRADQLREEAEKIDARAKALQREISDLKQYIARQKAIHIRLLSHYDRELRFWRDTIRAVLRQERISTNRVESFLSSVTGVLQTYGTQGKIPVIMDQVSALADSIREFPSSESTE